MPVSTEMFELLSVAFLAAIFWRLGQINDRLAATNRLLLTLVEKK